MDFNTYSDNCPIGNTGRKDNAYADYINKRTGQRGIRGTLRYMGADYATAMTKIPERKPKISKRSNFILEV